MRNEKITRKGQFLFDVLLVAVIAPSAFLIRREYVEFALIQLISLVIIYFFVIYYPQLVKFKNHYFIIQSILISLGVILFFNPDFLVASVLVVMFIVIIGLHRTSIELSKILSN
jgi:hypothetical protein